MTIRQCVYSLGLGILLLAAGHFMQSSLWQANCIYDLTCWYRIMPSLVKLVDPVDVLQHRQQMNDLISKTDSLYWDETIPEILRIAFSREQLTVSDLIELLGEPQQVYVVQAFSYETNCAALYIAYPDKGVVTANVYPEEGFVGVNASQSIYSLTLVTAELAQRWRSTDVSMHEWQGFINYCDLHDLTLNLR